MNFIPKIEYIELGTGLAKVVTFDSPPEGDPYSEEYKPSMVRTKSNNGRIQTQFNYLTKMYTLNFVFQSEVVKAAVLDFYKVHGVRGGKFNYFESSDEIEYEEFELTTKGFALGRPIPALPKGNFEYDFSIKIERVESVL